MYRPNWSESEASISGKYEAMLRRDGENYVVRLPISQHVARGGVSRFVIRLGVPCTSTHRFSFELKTTGNDSIVSEPITLNALLPRRAVEALRRSDR
jgi:hypothetical protein